MSPVLEERMLAAIGDAKTCPHGHPIRPGTRIEGVPLADVELGATVQVLRFENEAEDLLHVPARRGHRARHGGHAGREGRRRRRSTPTASASSLTASVAETVSVLADPSPPPRTALPEQLVLAQGPLRPLEHAEPAADEHHAEAGDRHAGDDAHRVQRRAAPSRLPSSDEPGRQQREPRQRPAARPRAAGSSAVSTPGELELGDDRGERGGPARRSSAGWRASRRSSRRSPRRNVASAMPSPAAAPHHPPADDHAARAPPTTWSSRPGDERRQARARRAARRGRRPAPRRRPRRTRARSRGAARRSARGRRSVRTRRPPRCRARTRRARRSSAVLARRVLASAAGGTPRRGARRPRRSGRR